MGFTVGLRPDGDVLENPFQRLKALKKQRDAWLAGWLAGSEECIKQQEKKR